jgi:hypothetical protein
MSDTDVDQIKPLGPDPCDCQTAQCPHMSGYPTPVAPQKDHPVSQDTGAEMHVQIVPDTQIKKCPTFAIEHCSWKWLHVICNCGGRPSSHVHFCCIQALKKEAPLAKSIIERGRYNGVVLLLPAEDRRLERDLIACRFQDGIRYSLLRESVAIKLGFHYNTGLEAAEMHDLLVNNSPVRPLGKTPPCFVKLEHTKIMLEMRFLVVPDDALISCEALLGWHFEQEFQFLETHVKSCY